MLIHVDRQSLSLWANQFEPKGIECSTLGPRWGVNLYLKPKSGIHQARRLVHQQSRVCKEKKKKEITWRLQWIFWQKTVFMFCFFGFFFLKWKWTARSSNERAILCGECFSSISPIVSIDWWDSFVRETPKHLHRLEMSAKPLLTMWWVVSGEWS